MIFPIGHDGMTVRRWPWATFTIIAFNAVIFIATNFLKTTGENELQTRLVDVALYWNSHPELVVPPDVKEIVHGMINPRFESALKDSLRKDAEIMPDDFSDPQQVLDLKVERLRDVLDTIPAWRWGSVPAKPSMWRMITSMFIHGSFWHILFNMYFLYLAGSPLENRWGWPTYIVVYLICGVIADLTHMCMNAGSYIPTIGASGAIAGLMGAFMLCLWNRRITFFYWFGLIWCGTFDAPAWLMLLLWAVQQILFGLIDSMGGVAYWAHVGGFVGGVMIAFGLKKLFKDESRLPFTAGITSKDKAISHLEKGERLSAQGDDAIARQQLLKALEADPGDPEIHLALWNGYVQEGNPKGGALHIQVVIEAAMRRGDWTRALEYWRILRHYTGWGGSAALRWQLAKGLA